MDKDDMNDNDNAGLAPGTYGGREESAAWFSEEDVKALERLEPGQRVRLTYRSRRDGNFHETAGEVSRPPTEEPTRVTVWIEEDEERGEVNEAYAGFGRGRTATLVRRNPSRNTRLGALVSVEVIDTSGGASA